MSVIKVVDLMCDWPDCGRIGPSDPAYTATEARQQLRQRGWGRKRTNDAGWVDLCSTHNRRPRDFDAAFTDHLEGKDTGDE